MATRKKPKITANLRNKELNKSLRIKDRKRHVESQIHVGLQDRLEREIKIRDGASRLMSACTHENQLLEAAKTLHTSNARTFAYMAELQKLKAAEVMDTLMDEPGFSEKSKICKGRVAISDLRIPLIWKEIFANSKPKEHGKHAVFCLLTLGSEVQDTDLACIDKTTTDISFNDVIVFENAPYDFRLRVDVYAYPMSNTAVSAPTPQKLFSRLNRSIGRSEGKRTRERLNSGPSLKAGPRYEKLGSLVLTMEDLGDSLRSHDLERVPSSETSFSLPLYQSITFRLVAQPKCITDRCLTGFLNFLVIGSVPSWTYLWCEVKAGYIKGWKNPEDVASKDPHFSMDLIRKDVKINEIEKARQKRSHSFQVRDFTERYLFAADDKDDLIKWIRGLRQHKNDHAAWSVACDVGPTNDTRQPMFISSPSPRKLPSELIFGKGVRKTLVYDQLGMDSPLKAMTDAIKCTDLLRDENVDPAQMTSSVQSMLLENQATAPWTGFFTGLSSKPAKVTKVTDVQSQQVDQEQSGCKVRSTSATRHRDAQLSGSNKERVLKPSRKARSNGLPAETSGSDDAFLSDSDEGVSTRTPTSGKPPHSSGGSSKKKRKAPLPPREKPSRASDRDPTVAPPKPPLPKFLPKGILTRGSLSSASSLDDILEGPHGNQDQKSFSKSRHFRQSSRGVADGDEMTDPATSTDSLIRSQYSCSSGYRSESETASICTESSTSSQRSERIWEKRQNCVMPTAIIPLSGGDDSKPPPRRNGRSQSLDFNGVPPLPVKSGSSGSQLLSPPSIPEVIYAEPEPIRPRTNTLPERSPARSRSRLCSTPSELDSDTCAPGASALNRKPVPAPRRSYMRAVESSKREQRSEHVYEVPYAQVTTDGDTRFTYRHLAYDASANVYTQAKPPVLPPKLSKKVKKPVSEPVYAEVDLRKKKAERVAKAQKVERYAQAHKVMINVCKQRMKEESTRQEVGCSGSAQGHAVDPNLEVQV